MEYPKWLYKPDGAAVLVDDAEAERALGDGWYATPDAAAEAATKPKRKDR